MCSCLDLDVVFQSGVTYKCVAIKNVCIQFRCLCYSVFVKYKVVTIAAVRGVLVSIHALGSYNGVKDFPVAAGLMDFDLVWS